MNSEPRFLTVDDVLSLHAIAIQDQGGDPTIRDRGLLDSAVAAPAQQFNGQFLHQGIPAMATAYAFHISQNHPFIDGNKRAATAAMIAFLSDNGWSFDASSDEAEPVIVQLAAGSLSEAQFTEWAKKHMHEKPRMELREFFALMKYESIAEFLQSGLLQDNPTLAHKERFETMKEAASAIPAINEANLGALRSEQNGDQQSAVILRAQSHLLTAIYRIAEDMGYEW